MRLYFFILRLAALLGHHKARLLVDGQKAAINELREWVATLDSCQVLWFHVASVGEFEQARPIIERLRSELPFRKVLLTFFSPSGYELRKNYPMVDKVTYLPFATRKNARQLLKFLPLEAAVIVKYEFWPAYLKALKKNNVPTYLISATFRPNQLFFKPWGGFYLKLLYTFEHIFVQDEASADLLLKHNVKHVTVAGDTRFDRVLAVQKQAKDIPLVERFVADASQVIVAGSTWFKDEAFLAHYLDEHPSLKLILAPHEIDGEHLHDIFQLFEGRYVCYTKAQLQSMDKARVLLVDTIGMLSSLYRYGHVAYIGGGFGVGIHNTLEAAVYGVPIVFGPNWKKFREARGLIDAGAAVSVKNYKELAQALDQAFIEQKLKGQAASNYVIQECGATNTIIKALNL